MVEISNLMENAKTNMMNMMKYKKYYLAIFLFLVIALIVFALALHINSTISKIDENNSIMIKGYENLGGTELGSINYSNANHKHLLRDYYVMSSHNTCCGGNLTKDFVDIIAPKIYEFAISDKTGVVHVGTKKDSVFNKVRARKSNIEEMSREEIKSVFIPKDVSLI